jgi:hypothetical protein
MSDGAFVWLDEPRAGNSRDPARLRIDQGLDELVARIEALSERLAELEAERRAARALLALPLSRYLGEWLRARPRFQTLLYAADALASVRWSRPSIFRWRRGATGA